jgi:hypothetical protein
LSLTDLRFGGICELFINPGSVQFNGDKLTDLNASASPRFGDVPKLSEKHAVRLV